MLTTAMTETQLKSHRRGRGRGCMVTLLSRHWAQNINNGNSNCNSTGTVSNNQLQLSLDDQIMGTYIYLCYQSLGKITGERDEMSQDRISLGTNSDGARHFTIRLRHPHTQLVGLKYPLYYISNLLYHTLIKHDLKLVRNTTAKYTASCFHNHLSLLLPPPMMVTLPLHNSCINCKSNYFAPSNFYRSTFLLVQSYSGYQGRVQRIENSQRKVLRIYFLNIPLNYIDPLLAVKQP